MKLYKSATTRALCTLMAGALIIAFPTNATKLLIMAVGVLFLIPGLFSLITYSRQRKKLKELIRKQNQNNSAGTVRIKGGELFPIIGIGSVLFGIILLIFPSYFQSTLLYLLGAFLIIAALTQAISIYKYRKYYNVNFIPFVVSAIIGIAGIVIVYLNYKASASNTVEQETMSMSPTHIPSLIFGIASVVYGISELVYAICFRKPQLKSDKNAIVSKSSDKAEEYIDAEIVE